MDIKRAQELVDEYKMWLNDGIHGIYTARAELYREFIQAIADNNIEGDIELIARKLLEI